MLKPLLLSTLFLSISISSFADVQVSEKIRPQVKSLVNPDIDRLAIPPTPHNMSLPEFSQGVIGWGTGPQDAETRLNHVSKADVEKMKQAGLTVEIAKTWQNFYKNETQRNAGNPTAPLRAQLMKKIIDLW
ncbi:hypothetical protein HADU_07942 [Acinetobacter sp. HA]|uniref:DUF4951 domain-containing protein n=1 Tax=Acinetobacter sp. HA TaxID=1173062 RepID=UPI000263E05C|nr:DUF4951 domain-containing protein [Acinetobacter sp. HA]EIM39281.1 hypothetical protein HADU_07942 [Acinetobacter sp. HA]